MMIEKTKGPAEAATSPDRGSNRPGKDWEMNNELNNTTKMSAASCPLTADQMFKVFEPIWHDILVLQRKTHLLMTDLEGALDIGRARLVDGDAVTLMFQKRNIDITQWLAGEVWSDAAMIEEKATALIGLLEEAFQ